jgi:hypothetical protein
MASLHGDSSAGKSDLCCSHSLDAVGRPGLHQSSLMSFCFAGCFSPGPRKNDLTIYWALGPFVRSFTLLVDPGDIYLPQRQPGLGVKHGNTPHQVVDDRQSWPIPPVCDTAVSTTRGGEDAFTGITGAAGSIVAARTAPLALGR